MSNFKPSFNQFLTNLKQNYLAYLVIIFGFIGTLSAFYLLYDRIEIYKDPNFVPGCSINIWLDCGRVMLSKWASLFGFPNAMIGLMTYPMAILTGIFMLANKQNNKFVMLGAMYLSGFGVIMNLFLLYISAYLISTLCPWCLVAGVCTSNIFGSILTYNILNGHLNFGKNGQKIQNLIHKNWNIAIVIGYYFGILAFVALSFLLPRWEIYIKFPDPVFWLK